MGLSVSIDTKTSIQQTEIPHLSKFYSLYNNVEQHMIDNSDAKQCLSLVKLKLYGIQMIDGTAKIFLLTPILQNKVSI